MQRSVGSICWRQVPRLTTMHRTGEASSRDMSRTSPENASVSSQRLRRMRRDSGLPILRRIVLERRRTGYSRTPKRGRFVAPYSPVVMALTSPTQFTRFHQQPAAALARRDLFKPSAYSAVTLRFAAPYEKAPLQTIALMAAVVSRPVDLPPGWVLTTGIDPVFAWISRPGQYFRCC